MKGSRNTSIIRLLCLMALVAGMISCVTFRSNYLGSSNLGADEVILLRPPSAEKRRILQNKADSLVRIITIQKDKNRHLRGREINQLYSGFGEQLNLDRYYHYKLQQIPVSTDSLSYDQYLAELELMSSASTYERIYQTNRIVRRALNRGEPGNNIPKHVLRKSQNFLYAPALRKVLELNFPKYYNSKTDSLFKQIPATNPVKAFRQRFFRGNDLYHAYLYSFTYGGSYMVGNTIGLFHSHSDKLRNADLLGPTLQPFDIVIMKSPHHLTDQFIPGYFGHVGIWLGNDLASKLTHRPTKLDESKGRSMVEVLRRGVRINTLRDFCDGDVFLVIRLSNLSEEQKKTILVNLTKQLKKGYDFNFDIESPETLTCTELIYLTFDFIDWHVRYTWSRYTLTPDDLVETAIDNKTFEVPVFIKNGFVRPYPDSTFIRSLIGLPGQ